MIKNLIFFLFYLICNPRFLRVFLNNIYLPVYIQYEWTKGYKISTVIDVGAYRGYVSNVFNYLFPQVKIYAFEPTDEIDKLSDRNLSNIIVERFALSDKLGYSYFNKTFFGPASSLLPLSKIYGKTIKVAKKSKVKITTLDMYFKNKKLEKPIFLKIDTQGTERAILGGASKLLRNVAIIHIESPIKELYKGQSYFEDIYKLLTKNDFRFIGDIPDSQFYPRFSPPDVINCIYVNTKLLGDYK